MRGAARLRLPKTVAALFIILFFFGGVGALGFSLSGPAADWVSRAPSSLEQIEDRLFVFKQPIANLQTVGKQVETIAEGPVGDNKPVTVAGPGVSGLPSPVAAIAGGVRASPTATGTCTDFFTHFSNTSNNGAQTMVSSTTGGNSWAGGSISCR